jgi:ribosomal protein S18 acetylase RimI-like enzyme
VHEHHAQTMPELSPYVSNAATWRERRSLYENLLRKRDTLLLLASKDEHLVGYALVHLAPASDTWVGDTWATGDRIAEVESLSVAPEHRGAGIGRALLERCHAEIRAVGVDDIVIGVLAGNSNALRLYTRLGYKPTWLYLSRFSGR